MSKLFKKFRVLSVLLALTLCFTMITPYVAQAYQVHDINDQEYDETFTLGKYSYEEIYCKPYLCSHGGSFVLRIFNDNYAKIRVEFYDNNLYQKSDDVQNYRNTLDYDNLDPSHTYMFRITNINSDYANVRVCIF